MTKKKTNSSNLNENNKITQRMMILGNRYALNFNVEYNKPKGSDANKDVLPHSPHKYDDSAAGNTGMPIDCYLSLEALGTSGVKVTMRPIQVSRLLYTIEHKVLPWFTAYLMYGDTYTFKGVMEMNEEYENVKFWLSSDSYLTFTIFWLHLIEEYEDGKKEECYVTDDRIEINVNGLDIFDVCISEFLQFYYIISYTNIYEAAVKILKEYNIIK
ncbi:MAG: hypothetical protein LUG99_12025 [Lachnospiraceae bacterium]|nr:hypothetical protein [Lachnospiraceae bacterium]